MSYFLDRFVNPLLERYFSFQIEIGPPSLPTLKKQNTTTLSRKQSQKMFPSHKYTSSSSSSSKTKERRRFSFCGPVFPAATEKSAAALGEPGQQQSKEEDEKDVCCICIQEFAIGDDIRTLKCLHFYHVCCIDNWFQVNAICPMCKRDVKTKKNIFRRSMTI